MFSTRLGISRSNTLFFPHAVILSHRTIAFDGIHNLPSRIISPYNLRVNRHAEPRMLVCGLCRLRSAIYLDRSAIELVSKHILFKYWARLGQNLKANSVSQAFLVQ